MAIVLAASSAPAAATDQFLVIVNPSVPGTAIPRRTLAAIFLKQSTRWTDNSIIEPIDQSAKATIRARFTEGVFGQPVQWVTTYWGRAITSGSGRPPLVKGSDEEVIAHIARSKGAIGYVSADARLDDSVKVLEVTE